MAEPRRGELTIRPLTPSHVDDVKTVMAGTWGSTCWDLFPRFTAKQERERGLTGKGEAPRRAALARLARRRNAPGLIAYRDGQPIGWVSIGPRRDFTRIEVSRATPPVDDLAVWVIPCITVRRGHRGKGTAIALIRAAVRYAGKHGAPAVEAYPRKESKRLHDDFAFYGTEAMFRKASFRRVRGPLAGLPKNWTPRVTMRAATGPVTRRRPASAPSRARATASATRASRRARQGR
jgi:GNAT superfamily N-acetyltransferase